MKLSSINPATGELIESFDEISDAELETALQRAEQTFRSYRNTAFAERAGWLRRTHGHVRGAEGKESPDDGSGEQRDHGGDGEHADPLPDDPRPPVAVEMTQVRADIHRHQIGRARQSVLEGWICGHGSTS